MNNVLRVRDAYAWESIAPWWKPLVASSSSTVFPITLKTGDSL